MLSTTIVIAGVPLSYFQKLYNIFPLLLGSHQSSLLGCLEKTKKPCTFSAAVHIFQLMTALQMCKTSADFQVLIRTQTNWASARISFHFRLLEDSLKTLRIYPGKLGGDALALSKKWGCRHSFTWWPVLAIDQHLTWPLSPTMVIFSDHLSNIQCERTPRSGSHLPGSLPDRCIFRIIFLWACFPSKSLEVFFGPVVNLFEAPLSSRLLKS